MSTSGARLNETFRTVDTYFLKLRNTTVDDISTSATLAGNSNTKLATEQAAKSYVDSAGGRLVLLAAEEAITAGTGGAISVATYATYGEKETRAPSRTSSGEEMESFCPWEKDFSAW